MLAKIMLAGVVAKIIFGLKMKWFKSTLAEAALKQPRVSRSKLK